ncbi:hypothetical protein EC968_008228, partial [Mortierella alpina]
MVLDEDISLTSVDILPTEERRLLLHTWNETQERYPGGLCLHQLFEQQVERTPEAVAIVFEALSLTYEELNTRANLLANRLIALGVKPDTPVAICVERSPAMIIGILAILKAGGAYVPLDPLYASDRLKDIICDSAPSVLLADHVGRQALGEAILSSLTTLDPNTQEDYSVGSPQVVGLAPQHLAYIIYTSGSTGKPKGVMIEHQGVVSFIALQQQTLQIQPSSRMTQFFSVSFDPSVLEVFSTLCFGGSLHLLQDGVRMDTGALWQYVNQHRITHVVITPSALQGCNMETTLPSVSTLLFGGESLPTTILQKLCALVPNGRIINQYGPTEATVAATASASEKDNYMENAVIGRPLANKTIYLLDSNHHPVPLGAVGEIFIGGVGIARGYLNQPDLTAARFIPDAFSNDSKARMYKTGDLARYLPDGNLVYMGRIDHQIKIRGFRIELGEIETRLHEHPLVSDAVVVAIGESTNKRLVAYVIMKAMEGDGTQMVARLRSHLAMKLPEYMVPAAFVRLDAFPLTPNGKLDRRALPAPGNNDYARQEYEAPQGEIELALASIWSDLLNIENVSRHDSFFALGGHSLLAIQMISRLNHLGHSITVQSLFDSPTLAALAQTADHRLDVAIPFNLITPTTTQITPKMLPLIDLNQTDIDHIAECVPGGVANIQDIYALSPLQDGILFHHLMAEEGDPYLLFVSMSFETRELLDRYLGVIQHIVDRHDILRTAFVFKELSTPAQVVWRNAPLSITELQLDSSVRPVTEQLKQMFDPRIYKIDLTKAPLLRFVIAQQGDGTWVLLELLHHLVGDHSTLQTMQSEIKAFYDGQGDTLPSPQPYRNLIAQVRLGVSQEEHEGFFKKMLADIDTPSLPFGIRNVHGDGTQITESGRMLPQELNNRLRAQSKRLGVSVASLCHVAWAQVIARTSGQQHVVFGTVLFGRMQATTTTDRAMGLFINTLPIRVDLDRDNVEESVRGTHSRLAALLDHEHASLTLAQRCSNVAAGEPLFSSLLNYRHNSSSSADTIMEGMTYLESQERTTYPFCLSVEDFGTSLGLTVQVVQPLNADRVCGYMQRALDSLVGALEDDPTEPISRLEVLPDDERLLLLEDWNATQESYPDDLCLHQLFEQQVERTPEAIAIVHRDLSLTYTELNTRANSLAHRLIALGVHPDTPVAICVERAPAMIIGILAILKAGGAYVPLDPLYASDRLKDIISDAAPSLLLVDHVGREVLGDAIPSSMTTLDPNLQEENAVRNPQGIGLVPQHLAYIIYTSGSTGKPKGVMIEHQGVVNYITSQQRQILQIQPSSRMVQFSSLSFDCSVLELFNTLCFGGGLHLLPNNVRLDLDLLWHYLNEHRITHALLTPSVLQDCERLPPLTSMKRFIVGAEVLPMALVKKLHKLVPAGVVTNEYGPTEVTVAATSWTCFADCFTENAPIGRPLANRTIYLLDSNHRPVPLGAVGEIFIGGVGIARGYLNQPDLTGERFIPDTFSNDSKARMYKTGDLARYLPDGTLLYMGRSDDQTKIRGFRIELGEIEARLHEHPLVSDAVVVAIGESTNKRLVAYVIMNATEDNASQIVARLRSHLALKLPEYMVPAAFVRLDAFPLTPNGKLDRRALPLPGNNDFVRQEYEAPQGEIEIALASIWSDLLNIENVSRHDSFFALGGHSLLAIQMISRLNHLGHSITVQSLFDSPTLAALAQTADHRLDVAIPFNLITPTTTQITPKMLPLIDLNQTDIDHIAECVPGGVANIQDIYALSPLQDGILFHHLMAEEGDPYLLFVSMSFETRELLDRYLGVIQHIVDRHDILRTAFVFKELSTPAQVVWRNAPLSITELQLDASVRPVTEQLKQMFDPRIYRIDLTQAPLLRFVIAQQGDGTWVLVQLLHHLIGDHSTLEIMQSEITAFYNGQGDTLPSPQPYRNLIAQVRLGVSQEEHEGFFKKMLADIDTPSLPFGIRNVHGDGTQITESGRMLPQELNQRLRSQSKRLGVSVASLCHVAWAQVIARTSGQQHVVFGTVLFGRMQATTTTDRAMGLFVNTLPIRVDLDKDNVEESVRGTHSRLAALLEHEHASLALAQRCSSVVAGEPLFNSLLNYRHNAHSSPDKDMDGVTYFDSQERTNYPFCISVEDFGTSLGLTVQVVHPLDADRVCGYMQRALDSLVGALEDDPTEPISRLEVLPKEERRLLLEDWNATQESYPDDLCLHQLFEQQVERTPEAVAIVHGDLSLTYDELNTRANFLAHRLIDLGVKPDTRVAICVERSPTMIIGILAILKAGGAYVPLDPSHASNRLLDILHEAFPVCLVADQVGLASLDNSSILPFPVVDPHVAPSHPISNAMIPSLNSHHLAYIIFTSGTTGKPKGVMVEHQGVVNHITSQQHNLRVSTASRMTQFFSVAFDGSVPEIFVTLCFGGSLHLLQNDVRMDISALWRYLDQHRITHATLTPSMLQGCDMLTPLRSLSTLLFGGESLPTAIVEKLCKLVPNVRIINAYGPTEATVAATSWTCSEGYHSENTPIGRPLANKTIYLLDSNHHPVPLGAVGEIFIGGVGIARGYLNQPDLTAARFIPDAFSNDSKARMYKTGDLAKYLPDGNLVYVGRSDHQVKIRGFRIELREIEAQLHEHPLVSEAVVVALGENCNKRLVAYVIMNASEGDGLQAVAGLRSHLALKLPEYMVPAAFVRMDSFPLTPNGKLNRRALPAPEDNDYARQEYEAPQGEIEIALALIWSDLLHIEN